MYHINQIKRLLMYMCVHVHVHTCSHIHVYHIYMYVHVHAYVHKYIVKDGCAYCGSIDMYVHEYAHTVHVHSTWLGSHWKWLHSTAAHSAQCPHTKQ